MIRQQYYIIIAILGCLLLSCDSGYRNSDADRVRALATERLREGKTYLLVPGMDDAISYYADANDTIHLIEMYRLASMKMRWKDEQDSAEICLLKALDLATVNTTPSICDIYLELADLYSHPLSKKDYRRAIEYAAKAYETDSETKHRAGILHDIGIYHAFLNEIDSAAVFLERALALTPVDSPEYTQLALNYANLPAPDFDKSIRYLDTIESVSLGKLITKGFLYLNHGYPDSAAKYVRYAGDLYYSSPDRYSINTYNNLRILSNCVAYAMSGKAPGEGSEINDSISERIALSRKIAAETEECNTVLEIDLLTSRTITQRVVIVALVVILLGGIVFALIFWRSKRKYIALHKELDLLRRNQIMVEAEKTEPAEETGSFEIIVRRAGICVDRLRETGVLDLIQKGEDACNSSGAYLSIKDRTTVREALLDCFADFIVDIKMDAGKLTMDDIVTALLGVMRVSNAGIAACLGASVGAVRTRKTRLKSKMSPEMAQFVFG